MAVRPSKKSHEIPGRYVSPMGPGFLFNMVKSEELLGALYRAERKRAISRAKGIRDKPCSVCGWYGCICQTDLSEYVEIKKKIMKDRCPVCKLYLCDCNKKEWRR